MIMSYLSNIEMSYWYDFGIIPLFTLTIKKQRYYGAKNNNYDGKRVKEV